MHFILLATNLEAKMNSLSEIYFTTERYLFPMVEEEIGEISENTLKNMIFCAFFKKKSHPKHQKWF